MTVRDLIQELLMKYSLDDKVYIDSTPEEEAFTLKNLGYVIEDDVDGYPILLMVNDEEDTFDADYYYKNMGFDPFEVY